MLEGFVERFKSIEEAVTAVGEHLYELQQTATLTTNANGTFRDFILVNGQLIEVRRSVIDGVIRIADFRVPRV